MSAPMTPEDALALAQSLEVSIFVAGEKPFPDTAHPDPLLSVVMSGREWAMVLALAQMGAECAGATEAWGCFPGSNAFLPVTLWPTRGEGEDWRRILILPSAPGGPQVAT